MSYGNELIAMLRPLGVYSFREGSFSLAELQALGAALDEADEALSRAQKETIVKSRGSPSGKRCFEAGRLPRRSRPDARPLRAFSGSAATALRLRRSTGACARAALRAAWKRPGRSTM